MDVMEKLVELIRKAHKVCKAYKSCHDCPRYGYGSDCVYLFFADQLIANGVTVQQWIPVTERLPQNDTYILVTTDGVVASAYWHKDRFYAFTASGVATVCGVTHWMPLPEPPKGE